MQPGDFNGNHRDGTECSGSEACEHCDILKVAHPGSGVRPYNLHLSGKCGWHTFRDFVNFIYLHQTHTNSTGVVNQSFFNSLSEQFDVDE